MLNAVAGFDDFQRAVGGSSVVGSAARLLGALLARGLVDGATATAMALVA